MSSTLAQMASQALETTIPDTACVELGLPSGSSYGKAVLMSVIERALRGSTADARLLLELGGSLDMTPDYCDALSDALFELNRRHNGSESLEID